MNDLYHRFPRSLREANWMRHNAGLETFNEDRVTRSSGWLPVALAVAILVAITLWGVK